MTDAIDALTEKAPVDAVALTGQSYNCGEKLGYMQAYVAYGLRHPQQGAEFKAWLKEFMA